jgi:hypothetical protein
VAVIAVPSSNASGRPVCGSKVRITAWWVGSGPPAFCGNSVTSLLIRIADDGTKPGIAARKPPRSGTAAATRSGTDAAPSLRSTMADANASINASRSSSASICGRVRTSTRHLDDPRS